MAAKYWALCAAAVLAAAALPRAALAQDENAWQGPKEHGALGTSDDPTPVKVFNSNWAGNPEQNWRGQPGQKFYHPGGECRQKGPCGVEGENSGKNQYPEASQIPYAPGFKHVDVKLDEDKGNMDPDGHYRTGEKYDVYGRVPTRQQVGQASTLLGYDFDNAYDLAGSPSGGGNLKPLPSTRCVYSSMQNMKNPRGVAEDGPPNNNNGKGYGDLYTSFFHNNEVISKTNANCVGATQGSLT